MEIGVGELKGAKKDLEKAVGNIDDIVKSCIDDIALRVYRSVKRTTPQDTGHLWEEWTIGPIVKKGSVYEVEILNPVEYARYVEYGHRLVVDGTTVGWVDGFFMLTIAEREVNKRVDRIVKNRIEKYLKRLLK